MTLKPSQIEEVTLGSRYRSFVQAHRSMRILVWTLMLTIGIPALLISLPIILGVLFKKSFAPELRNQQAPTQGKPAGLWLTIPLTILGILAIISSGAIVWGVLTTGELCFRASRTVSMSCFSVADDPVSVIGGTAAFYAIFWLTLFALAFAFFGPSRK